MICELHTGWSRKIETAKFGCIYSRGWSEILAQIVILNVRAIQFLMPMNFILTQRVIERRLDFKNEP